MLPDAMSTAFLESVFFFRKCFVPEVIVAIEPAKSEVPKAIYGIWEGSTFVKGRIK
jgi:hypothetical protein